MQITTPGLVKLALYMPPQLASLIASLVKSVRSLLLGEFLAKFKVCLQHS